MYANPAIIGDLGQKNQKASLLQAVSLEKPPYNEEWLQNLVQAHPNLVPSGEIEACFDNIVPILCEFSLPSGYLDNFYITPDGYPVLVEVKLWKNQEARRKVVAQILEYAKDFSALQYEDINSELRKHNKNNTWGANPLYEIVTNYVANPPIESVFVDRVSRNLREGRFLLLILGDGIREEMATLAQYLMHHSLRYAFGMIQIRLFTLPDGNIVALPEVITKTQIIERHVTVVTTGGDLSITAKTSLPIVSEKVAKTSLSLEEFYEQMSRVDPGTVTCIKILLQKLEDLSVEAQVSSNGEAINLKATLNSGDQLNLMRISPNAVEFWGIPWKFSKNAAWQKLARAWLEQVSAIIPGTSVKTFDSGHADIKCDGKKLLPGLLRGHEQELAEAIRQVIRDAEAYFVSEHTNIS